MTSFSESAKSQTPEIPESFRVALESVVGDVLVALDRSTGSMDAYSHVEQAYRAGVKKASKLGGDSETLILAKLGKHFGKNFTHIRQVIYLLHSPNSID